MIISFLVQVVNHFLRYVVLVIHRQPELAFLRSQHDRLSFHPADHVKWQLGLSPESHLEKVLLDALLDGLPELALDLEVPVRRAEASDALVRPLVVVVLDPLPDPLGCVLEALELGAA
jgi:hypothetical protein